jgi:hypothetical protein
VDCLIKPYNVKVDCVNCMKIGPPYPPYPPFCIDTHNCKSRDSSVGIATRLRAGRPDDRGSIPGGGWEFLSSPTRPDRLWGPPNLLSNGYRERFPCG